MIVCLTVASLLVACSGLPGGTYLAVPSIPGSEYVGAEQCSVCHPDIRQTFDGATHAHLGWQGDAGLDRSCELCHGPGSQHVANGGMGYILALDRSPEGCFACHIEKRAQAGLPHAHPILRGQVGCADCHDPHAGPSLQLTDRGLSPESQACFQCHAEQAGPFVFEHEALREGCTTCHEPHGSLNAGMLKVRDGNLCLQCHITQTADESVVIGQTFHTQLNYLPQGACWTSGCHEAVHGSNVDSNLRF